MAIPDFQSLMLPLLKLLADKQEHAMREVTTLLSDQFQLTERNAICRLKSAAKG